MSSTLSLALLLAVAFVAGVTANPSERIVGGLNAEPGQFPYQISLRRDHRHTCGGAIISNNFILTAAHCVVVTGTEAYDAKHFTVRAGSHNRIAGGVLIQVKRVIVNQNYNAMLNDLALLELEEDLVYSDFIQPIELAEEEVPAGSDVIISGWGLLETEGADSPIMLKYNTVEAISKTKCATMIGMYFDALICLNHPRGVGACFGDSGGPAAYDGKLVGVAGFVVTGCGSTRPDGYAKVSHNIDWIHENMQ